jgi:uncharacterized protein (UPF0218 family)
MGIPGRGFLSNGKNVWQRVYNENQETLNFFYLNVGDVVIANIDEKEIYVKVLFVDKTQRNIQLRKIRQSLDVVKRPAGISSFRKPKPLWLFIIKTVFRI